MSGTTLPVYPVSEIIPQLKECLQQQTVAILEAPPGAGKSTLVPLHLLEEEFLQGRKIIMLEPRRLAAKAVATRMASLTNTRLGDLIGYRIKMESRVSDKTKIEIVTEGILTRLIQSDSSLEDYGLIIFDEFHERSIHADLALTLVKEIKSTIRPDLRLLVMSATLNTSNIQRFLNGQVITSAGKQFPVDEIYVPTPPESRLPEATAEVIRKAWEEQTGDLLVFLPGTADILRTASILSDKLPQALITPLYGDLPFQKQQEAIEPNPHKRKIVLSTSIAETSLTIEGITTVIDSGFTRTQRFDPAAGLSRLTTVKITADAAEQRKGRAGRLGPGVVYRMWARAYQDALQPERMPEISDADLSPLALELAKWGETDPSKYEWLTPPPPKTFNAAIALLSTLGALEKVADRWLITSRGKEIASYPAHPRIGNLLVAGKSKNPVVAALIAAIIEERDFLDASYGIDIYHRVKTLVALLHGDHVRTSRPPTQVISSARRWLKITGTNNPKVNPDPSVIGELLLAAYPDRVAVLTETKGRFKLSSGGYAGIAEDDPLASEKYIVIAEADMGRAVGKIFLATSLEDETIHAHAQWHNRFEWDEREEKLICREEKKYGQLDLQTRALPYPPAEQLINLYNEVIRQHGQFYLDWNEDTHNLINRINAAGKWDNSVKLPEISQEWLLNHPEIWLEPFYGLMKARDDFKSINLKTAIESMLNWEQKQFIDSVAPTHLTVPSGSLIALKYQADGASPVLAVRLQEVFGLMKSPTLAGGKITVTMHLLSPAYRPVQVTKDIAGFWKNTYQEVRKELRMKYPRHSWPEDPYTAEAIKGVKKRK